MKESYEGRRMTYVLVYTHFTLFCGNRSHVSHLTCFSPCLSSHHVFLISPSLSSHHLSSSFNLSQPLSLPLSSSLIHNTILTPNPLNCLTPKLHSVRAQSTSAPSCRRSSAYTCSYSTGVNNMLCRAVNRLFRAVNRLFLTCSYSTWASSTAPVTRYVSANS